MIYVLLLVAVTAVWGWTFVLVKDAISHYPTLQFLSLRFLLAFAVMAVVVHRPPGRRVLKLGALIGSVLAAGYLLQTVGLAYTSPGNAGLITGLFVVFTPLLERLTGRPVAARSYVATLIALAGTALLTAGGGRFGPGDVLVVGCAFCFALHIVLLSHWAPDLPSAPLAMVQMLTAGILFTAAGVPNFRLPPGQVWGAILVTGVVASAVGFFIQTWAQRQISASRTAVILATEPAWALLSAVLLVHQTFGPVQGLGAAMLLAAILGHEVAGARTTRVAQGSRADT